MKKAVFVLALAALTASGCAELQQSVRRTAGLVVSGLPQVTAPGVGRAGFALGGQNIVFDNGTPFYGRLVILDKEVAGFSVPFGPGDKIVATKYYEPFHGAQIPVVVTFYRDPQLTQCVGGVGRVFGFWSGQSDSIPWPIVAREIQTLEGGGSPAVIGLNQPLPLTTQTVTVVEMPREFVQGTVSIQATNLSAFDTTVSVTGVNRVVVPPCGTYYKAVTEILGEPRSVSVELTFTQPGGLPGQTLLHGKQSIVCPVPSSGVTTCQILANPWMISR